MRLTDTNFYSYREPRCSHVFVKPLHTVLATSLFTPFYPLFSSLSCTVRYERSVMTLRSSERVWRHAVLASFVY